jgi:hypothetical protein
MDRRLSSAHSLLTRFNEDSLFSSKDRTCPFETCCDGVGLGVSNGVTLLVTALRI